MKSNSSLGAGLPEEPETALAANEEFTGHAELPPEPPARGWDPYQVWRTRVKHPVEQVQDRRR